MYVRCFTKTDEWEKWLSVKERLAIQIKQIVDIQVNLLEKSLKEKHINIKLTDSAKEFIVQEGFNPAYGARPLKRAIQNLVKDPLAIKLLKNEILPGQSIELVAEPSIRQLKFIISDTK